MKVILMNVCINIFFCGFTTRILCPFRCLRAFTNVFVYFFCTLLRVMRRSRTFHVCTLCVNIFKIFVIVYFFSILLKNFVNFPCIGLLPFAQFQYKNNVMHSLQKSLFVMSLTQESLIVHLKCLYIT